MHLSVTLERSFYIGCGTGAVTHEMATVCPKATTYMVNLSPAPGSTPSTADINIGSALEIAGKASSTHSTIDLSTTNSSSQTG